MIKNGKKYFLGLGVKLISFLYLKLAKPASKFFRGIFELKKIRQDLGAGFMFITLFACSFPNTVASFQTILDTNLVRIKTDQIEISTHQSLQKPVGIFKITKGYSFFHPAIDLATDAGTPVLPILPGKVEKVAKSRFGYGNHLIINHGSGLKSLYAHLSKINIKEGRVVDNQTIIGFIGSTGWSSGPHLHLEIIEDEKRVNPKRFFEDYFGEKLASIK